MVIPNIRQNKTPVCWAQEQGRIAGHRELPRHKMARKQHLTQPQLRDTDSYFMECKENPAAILASILLVLQLHLLKASF